MTELVRGEAIAGAEHASYSPHRFNNWGGEGVVAGIDERIHWSPPHLAMGS